MSSLRVAALMLALFLLPTGTAFAQVTFQPEGCEFRVWFVAQPAITKASTPMEDGTIVDAVIAELNPVLDDGYAHYFRAECTQVTLGPATKEGMIEDMRELARMNRLEDAKIWAEELHGGQMVGRVRASLDSGQRVYYFDIRRYVGESSLFDVWAGAEHFPTEGITMFFRSLAYRGSLIYE